MYIVVVGAGQIGSPLVEIATEEANEVVVVENDPERAQAAARDFDCLVLEDDATEVATLEDAGIDRADAVISTTDQDATNVMVCLIATEREVPAVVSVVHNPEHMGLFGRIGVTTMENPQRLIAEYLYRNVTRPSIEDYMRIGEQAEVFEIRVEPGAPIAGTTLAEAAREGLVSEEMLVVAIERGEGEPPITPRGSTRIESGDLLTVYSASGATPEVTDVFGHFDDHQ